MGPESPCRGSHGFQQGVLNLLRAPKWFTRTPCLLLVFLADAAFEVLNEDVNCSSANALLDAICGHDLMDLAFLLVSGASLADVITEIVVPWLFHTHALGGLQLVWMSTGHYEILIDTYMLHKMNMHGPSIMWHLLSYDPSITLTPATEQAHLLCGIAPQDKQS